MLSALLLAAAAAACATPRWQPNPSFAVSRQTAARDLARMQADPKPLPRPVVFLAGIGDLSISSGAMEAALVPTFEAQHAELHFFSEFTFDGARQKLLREVA
ncbi:MAG: hypothetical protein QM516_06795, partial [Limnohabitans sp.]|nr:hypothetical protein [Limnohabitans sp.]